jgi:tol-pal system protein YbgF
MTGRTYNLLVAAVIAIGLAIAPNAGDAAWWPWQKKKDAAPPPAAPTDITPPAAGEGSSDANPSDRIAQVEAEMRTLTGQVEQLTYQVQQLQDELQQLDAGKGIAKRPVPAGAAPTAGGGAAAGKSQPDAIARAVADAAPPAAPAGPGAPPRSLGAIPADAAPAGPAEEQPIDLSAAPRGSGDAGAAPVAAPRPAAPGARPPAAGAQPGSDNVLASLGDPRADYERAYNSILSGDYDRAEAGFRAFLAAHPEDEHAADAQYWLGESLFARGKYREAANEFLNGHKTYPKSAKAPDTLLKLGLSLAGLGERDAACSTYAQVLKQYPQASNALRQRIAVEQASASC